MEVLCHLLIIASSFIFVVSEGWPRLLKFTEEIPARMESTNTRVELRHPEMVEDGGRW